MTPSTSTAVLAALLQEADPGGPLSRLADLDLSTATALGVVGVLLSSWLALLVARRILLRGVHKLTEKTAFTWDDVITEHRVFHRLAHVAPALVVYYGIPLVADLPPYLVDLVQRVATAFMVIMFVAAAHAFLSAVDEIYVGEYEHAASRPIKGYLQIVSLLLWIAGGIVAVALLLDRSPLIFLSGLGALTAVLLIVFRTTILSLVASVQIASNDMVRVGDWIEMSQFGADGDVIDIALHTVKVQNWDKTITTIPTYKLVEESFRNWRGMAEAGGRRIKRSLMVDMNTIGFLDAATMERLSKLELLADYLEGKKREIAEWRGMRPDRREDLEPIPRRLTNIGTFRAYVLAYLKSHPGIHPDMTLLVRQLEPTPNGLPLQVYCFTRDTAWAVHENVQGDIFDHLLSMAPEFGLRIYQEPAGSDFRALAEGAGGDGRGGDAGEGGDRRGPDAGEGGSGGGGGAGGDRRGGGDGPDRDEQRRLEARRA